MACNKPQPFNQGLIESIWVDRPAVERRVARLRTGRSLKGHAQTAALIRAVQCLDLTTLSGDDTYGRVDRLCAKALQPIERATLELLGLGERRITVGAVCVYDAMVKEAVRCLDGQLPVAVVSTGFAAGQTEHTMKLREIRRSVKKGALEVDVVIPRMLALTGKWEELYKVLCDFREACGDAVKLKVILGVGDLRELTIIARAAMVAMLAGADTIKTSTGYEPTNATLESGLVMVRMIRRFHELYGVKVGLKPAGGLGKAKDALEWLVLVLEELGEEWTHPHLLRLGASKLLDDLARQLHHRATGRYARGQSIPMG